jgi:two-component system, cell cycle sensor histidine kinase and response regulator CckA
MQVEATGSGVVPSVPDGLAAALADTCANTIITSDNRGRVTWVSPSAEGMFGFRPEELVGWPVAELFPGGIEEARAVGRRLLAEGRLDGYASVFPASGGRAIPVSASIALLRDGTGATTGAIAVLMDMTERVEAGRLAGGIAHDFNNLITVIDGRCEVLLDRLAEDDASCRDIGIVRDSALRASALIRQLLFSRTS